MFQVAAQSLRRILTSLGDERVEGVGVGVLLHLHELARVAGSRSLAFRAPAIVLETLAAPRSIALCRPTSVRT